MVKGLTKHSHKPPRVVCQSSKCPHAIGKLLIIEPREQHLQMWHNSTEVFGGVVSQSGKGPHDIDQALLRRVFDPVGL